MIVFAMVITVFAFAQVGLVNNGKFQAGIFGYGVALLFIVAIAYGLTAKFAPYADPLIVPLAVLLNGLGVAMIYRIGYNGQALNANPTNQIMWTAISIGLFAITLIVVRDVRVLNRYRYTLGALGLFFIALPGMLPSSISGQNGAKVWLRLGGFSIQPGEFAKLALCVFFAGYLVTKRDALALVGRKIGPLELPRGRDLGPLLVAWGLSVIVLIIEHDIGQGFLFFGLFVAMLYIATNKVSWVIFGLLMFVVGAFATMDLFGHANARILIWEHPKAFYNGGCKLGSKIINSSNFAVIHAHSASVADFGAKCTQIGGQYVDSSQLLQGLFALGQGGLIGTGLGQGRPWLIPVSYADFIFDSFGNELGLAGCMAILLVYGLIIQRGMKAALATRDPFAKLFTGGITFTIGLQVFAIVGGVTGMIPLTGLTTPFLAQGGSSLLANWILIALLVRISDQARRPAPVSIQDEGLTQVVRGL
jgi:cell division protein FtsW (lipid II flippase)